MPNDNEFELDDLESFSFDDLSLDEVPEAAGDVPGEDPFGVWVKSAPEDVGAAEPAPADSPAPLDDPLLSEEDSLSTEELANIDDSFDLVTVSEVPLEGEVPLEEEMAFLDTPEALEAERASADIEANPAFDEVSLDDFVSFDDLGSDEPPAGKTLPDTGAEVPSAEDELNEDFLDIDIDVEDDINDEELEIIEGALPKTDDSLEEVSLDSFTSEDVDLSEFGDFEEVAPMDAPAADDGEDLPPVAIDDAADFLGEPEGFFEETVIEDPLSPLDEEHVELALEPDDQTDLDHILALEEDLTAGVIPKTAPEAVTQEAAAPASDLAALILGKIEQELSSIKQEISELKKEVTHLRVVPAPETEPAPVALGPTPEAADEGDAKPHGFFDEEDDETIALTGDELDNILSTAEISEGEEAGVSLDDDLLVLDAEGNLVDPAALEDHPLVDSEEVHVTDEEFFAGTSLDDQEGTQEPLGVPESIELEGLPETMDGTETEDLLGGSAEDFDIPPLPEGVLEANSAPLEIPFDEDIGLELDDFPALTVETPEAAAEEPAVEEEAVEELSLDALPSLEDLPPLEEIAEAEPEAVAEEWTPPSLSVDTDIVAAHPDLPPAPPAVPSVASVGGLSPNLKDELRAVLSYMDKLLASLPDDKIQEFAESEHFEVYKRLFEELGLVE
jgi:hypothetical protein